MTNEASADRVARSTRPGHADAPEWSQPDQSAPFLAGLFGRGLLYVAVTSLPIVTATVVSPVLAHVLGPTQFGLLASAISLHQVLMALAIFGVDQALILARAESGSDRTPRVLVTVGTLVAVALTAGVGSTFRLWSGPLGFPAEHTLALATACWTVPTAFLQLGLALLMAQDRLRAYAVVSILLTAGMQLVGLLFLIPDERSAALYAWGGLAGRLLAMGACLVVVRPLWAARRDWPAVRGAFALGLPIMLGSLSSFVLNSGDRLVIQRILGSAEAGRYQIAYVIGFEAITVFAYTGQAWAARFAEVRDEARRWRLLGQARDHLYELLAPALLAVNLAAPLLLRIFAPESFRPAGLLVVVFLVSLAGVPLISTLASVRALVTQHRTRPIAVGAGLAALVNLGLNIALVPVIGLSGAAAATAVAFAVQAVVQRAAIRPLAAWPRIPLRVIVPLVAATGVEAGFVFVGQSPRWIVIRTVLAALAAGWFVVTFLRGRAAHRAATSPAAMPAALPAGPATQAGVAVEGPARAPMQALSEAPSPDAAP